MLSKNRLFPVLSLMGILAFSISANADECYRKGKFSEPLSWLSSATWVEGLGAMALVDPFANRVKLFTPSGSERVLASPIFGQASGDFLPAELKATTDGFALSLVDGGTLFLDKNLKFKNKTALATLSTNGGVGVRTLYQWTVAGRLVVGYGSVGVKNQPDKYQLGVFTAPLGDTSNAHLLSLPSARDDYYVLGNDYFTSLDQRAYFMLPSATPAIYEVNGMGTWRQLNAFPPALRRPLPEIKTRMTGPKSSEALFAEIEAFTMPVGLYGYEGLLYLLVRHAAKGGTEWLLYQIDPARDRLVDDPLRLPTSTEHLAIVTSPDHWFLIERGKVKQLGQQNIESFITVPSSWITAKQSPLRGLQEPVQCPVKSQ